MFPISKRLFIALFCILISQLFANRNLFCQENTSNETSWQVVLEQLNFLDDIQENSKNVYLNSLIQLVKNLPKGPTKDQLSKISTNRAKLTLAKICIETKKFFWAEDIYLEIDIRKLSTTENKTLFDLVTNSLLLFPDRDVSKNLIELLKTLTPLCRKELTENPGQLKNLYQFYVQRQLFMDAMDLAKILWVEDVYHFNCGTLHSRAYRLRWVANNDFHLKLAKEHFEFLEKQYPNSPLYFSAKVNLFLLNAENKTPKEQIEMFKINIQNNIEKISIASMRDVLESFTNLAKTPETINLFKTAYQSLVARNGEPYNRELILSFLSEKSGLTLVDLVKIINENHQVEKSLPDPLKNANIINQIQYLAYWNSDWEPYADYYNPSTSFRFDANTNTSYLIAQNTSKNQVTLTYHLADKKEFPDYVFFDLKNFEGQNIYTILFNYDGKEKLVDKIVCSENATKIRIVITQEMKKSKKWKIIIKNNSKLKSPISEISAPVFLKIQNISDLDKKVIGN